ncbi:thermonuclease family protein [Mesobacillus jeotgali]|uniref:thermonuclease family protein n=1 Tax=Mesobacillus jeotgali TaxID=129985 RepID=UPI002148402B|nr:thermonuclease family protein [Mesobacillus jeotgali]
MRYIMNSRIIFPTLMMFFILPNLVLAHNGYRDELGGHFSNGDCMYLLHEPTSLTREASSIDELIGLIQQYNNNTDCTAGLSKEMIDLGGFEFQGEGKVTSNTEGKTMPKTEASGGKLQLGKTYEAELAECTDGDTAVFTINGKAYKTRFLYIDTPESTRTKEPFGPEAAQYTCSFLRQGEIKLETDGGNLFDKYDRLLAWVWVGNKLHQEEITKAGLVEDFYDYGSYNYENRIWSAMDFAKENGKGMYAGVNPAAKSENEAANKREEGNKQEDKPKKDVDKNQQEQETKDKEIEEADKKEGGIQEEGSHQDAGKQCGFLSGVLFTLLFYLIGPIKKSLGKRTLFYHRLWSKKWWLNILLGLIYALLCYITLLLFLIEVLHLFKNKKRRRG